MGPVSGGYLARAFGPRAVFCSSLVLVLADVAYIVLVLPESKAPSVVVSAARLQKRWAARQRGAQAAEDNEPVLPAAYSPLDALGVFAGDPLLSQVARGTHTGVELLHPFFFSFVISFPS